VFLTYKYRLLPTREQHAALEKICESQRQLYNAALEERIDCYRKTGRGRTYFDQCKAVAEWRRDDAEARVTPANLQRWTLQRLDDAYKAFFRRVRSRNDRVGFPRFRGAGRWRSFGFNEFCGIRWNGLRLRWSGLPGAMRVHLHRPPPPASSIRSFVFTRDAKGWTVCFRVDWAAPERRPPSTGVGIDLGLNVFAYQSDGVVIPSPRIARRAEKEMRRRQRALARCARGSKGRQKARSRLAALHTKIANTRATWLHQHSAHIANSYDIIAAEDLNVSGMIKNQTLARSIADASWSKFLGMVSYKAEKAGGTFVTVNPRNTSQRCSGCGELVPKSLAVRTHACPSCGLVIDRDWNAALNILAAVVGRGADNVARQGVRRPGNISPLPARDTTHISRTHGAFLNTALEGL
jgi:putative transposase